MKSYEYKKKEKRPVTFMVTEGDKVDTLKEKPMTDEDLQIYTLTPDLPC